ncbi:hypothetical protein AMK26_21895 [Streptomyces sp. CB03234]|nr:hypothetical protein AMK26_21895 [Streptomyces sp. CB03234]
MGGPEGGHESVLDGVGGLLTVPQRAQGDGPEPVTMAAYELTEGVRISGDMARQEILVGCAARFGIVQR